MAKPRYADHLDTLIALTTYLALTPKISRTAPGLAADLSLAENDVRSTLNGFPGVFRRSRTPSSEGESYYTLHARYALRKTESDAEEQNLTALRSDLLSTLLQFASQQAAQESSFDQFQRQLAHNLEPLGLRRRPLWWQRYWLQSPRSSRRSNRRGNTLTRRSASDEAVSGGVTEISKHGQEPKAVGPESVVVNALGYNQWVCSRSHPAAGRLAIEF